MGADNNIGSIDDRRVLVVGAGPVGLTAALALRARALPVTVLEAGPPERPRPGSRAIFVHRESLALLNDLKRGLGTQLGSAGLLWRTKRSLFRGKEVFAHTYPPPKPGRLPAATSLPQVTTEEMLRVAAEAAGVEFEWGTRVEDVTTSPQGVEIVTEDGRKWRAAYAIGADGARSTVREQLRIELEGSRSENAFVIVDVAEDPHDPLSERIFHYEHPAMDRRNVLYVPFIGGWRVDLQCRADDDADEFGGEAAVRGWLPRVMPPGYEDRITWVSTYTFLQVIAKSFSDVNHRVLLVGEAAHLFAPFGARGMNSGMVDADSAAGAIETALATSGSNRADAITQGFVTPRLAAAEHNRLAAGSALNHMLATNPVTRVRRRVAAHLAPRVRRAGAWLDSAPYGPTTGAKGARGKY